MQDDAYRRQVAEEWRELGFFCDLDQEAKEWILIGSRHGLLRFRDLLLAYAANPVNDMKSEHDHYGPYGYLEIMTWPEAGMDGHAIHGTLSDLQRLASLVEERLSTAGPGKVIRIADEYAPKTRVLPRNAC